MERGVKLVAEFRISNFEFRILAPWLSICFSTDCPILVWAINKALLLSFLLLRYFFIAVAAASDRKTRRNLLPLPRTVNSLRSKLIVSLFKEANSETRKPVENNVSNI